MLKRLSAYLIRLQNLNRIAAGLSRAAALRAGRNTDAADPGSWEFSAFSQNGEDGIIQRASDASVKGAIEPGEVQDTIRQRFALACRRFGISRGRDIVLDTAQFAPPRAQSPQAELF